MSASLALPERICSMQASASARERFSRAISFLRASEIIGSILMG